MIYPKFIKENSCIGIPAPSAGANNQRKINKILNETNIDFISMQRPFVYDPSFLIDWQMDDEAESKCKLCNNCYWKKTSTCFINRPATWDVENKKSYM